MKNIYPDKKITIIGGGIIGAMEAYFAYIEKHEIKSKSENNHLWNKQFTFWNYHIHLGPSLTLDEI